jgi:exopolysaccharide biosynthesis polyprenyl glycosylphosphotransferase
MVAEPYAPLSLPADRPAPASQRISAQAWVLSELVVVIVVGLAVTWRVGAGMLGVLLVLAVTAVAYRSRHALDASVHPATLSRDLSVLFSAVALAVAGDVVPTDALSQSAAVLAGAGSVVLLAAGTRRRLRPASRVLVVGDRASISRAAMRWSDGRALEVVAAVLTDPGTAPGPTLSIVGVPTTAGLEQVPALVRGYRADLVVVSSGDGVSDRELRRLSWLLEDQHVELVVLDAVGSAAPHRVVPVRLADTTALRVLPSRPSAPVRLAKAVLDRVLGLLLLVVCVPVLGLLVLVVRIDSPGPGLFRQVRIGRDGKTFVMYKLRTMTVDADRQRTALLAQNEASGPLFKIHDDPRVTRVGRLLRRTSLDELGQLLNVVRGEMSLIGPRPALPTEVAMYDDVELRRLAVRPGITGLWQVSGRSDLAWDAGMSLDLHYSDNWRLRGDASILARTFGAVVRRRGAY